jgi:hypothetical protein
MKNLKDFNSFISEKVEYAHSTINGEKYYSTWAGSSDKEKDFIKMIKDLPETLESIKVPITTGHFNPEQKEFKGPINNSKKNAIIKIVKQMTKEYDKKQDSIIKYQLSSYYGVSSPARHETDPAYISFRTKGSEKFGKAMSRGDYGSLD